MEPAFDHKLVVSVDGAAESEEGRSENLNHIETEPQAYWSFSRDKLPIFQTLSTPHFILGLNIFVVSLSGIIYTGVYTKTIH